LLLLLLLLLLLWRYWAELTGVHVPLEIVGTCSGGFRACQLLVISLNPPPSVLPCTIEDGARICQKHTWEKQDDVLSSFGRQMSLLLVGL
jgi:hypothetical protein